MRARLALLRHANRERPRRARVTHIKQPAKRNYCPRPERVNALTPTKRDRREDTRARYTISNNEHAFAVRLIYVRALMTTNTIGNVSHGTVFVSERFRRKKNTRTIAFIEIRPCDVGTVRTILRSGSYRLHSEAAVRESNFITNSYC